MRIGTGYDSHPFDEDRPLVLGGVEVPDAPGLAGHSDGDAIAHAIIDALLGAAGAGDIGTHFPPDDPAWEDADSLELLSRTSRILARLDYQVVNVDATVVTEAPRIGGLVGEMRERLASALGISPDVVSVKGKSNEGLGWIGRGEGLAVHAVALVDDVRPQPAWSAPEGPAAPPGPGGGEAPG